MLGPSAALSFALALHELGTNAVKYGAFSNKVGRVAVTSHVEELNGEPHLRFRWEETGGPAVTPPTHRGFGSQLIRTQPGSWLAINRADHLPRHGLDTYLRRTSRRIAAELSTAVQSRRPSIAIPARGRAGDAAERRVDNSAKAVFS